MNRHDSIAAWQEPRRPTFRVAARLLHGAVRRWQARRTVASLHGLSDYQLKDIGLSRSEVSGLFRR